MPFVVRHCSACGKMWMWFHNDTRCPDPKCRALLDVEALHPHPDYRRAVLERRALQHLIVRQ